MSDSHFPCRAHAIPDHEILLKATAQHGHRERACGLTARVRLPPAIKWSSKKLFSDAYQSQIQVASVKPNTVYNGRGKEWQQHTTKKTIFYTVGLAVRIFPATMRTFTKDTDCRSRAGARHGMCELTHDMSGEWHGNGVLCVNRPLLICGWQRVRRSFGPALIVKTGKYPI